MSNLKKYKVQGHYKDGIDFPSLPEGPYLAYTAEDCLTQIKINFHKVKILNIEPWKKK